jgi:transposase
LSIRSEQEKLVVTSKQSFKETEWTTTRNARLTVHSRERLVKLVLDHGWTKRAAARAFHVSEKTVAKWVRRFQEQGLSGLEDRTSKPHRSPNRTIFSLLERVLALRRLRWNGWRIAREVSLSRATVCRILRRAGLNRLRSLDPPPPVVRYEHKRPGELVHFDIKRLAHIHRSGHGITGNPRDHVRGAGYQYLHIAVDDHSRIGFAALLPDQSHHCSMRFFLMARAHFARFAIRRVLTDNGPCYWDGRFRQLMHRQHVRLEGMGLRPVLTRTHQNAKTSSSSGCMTTISTVLMLASTSTHQPQEQV